MVRGAGGPLGQGDLLSNAVRARLAKKHAVAASAVALTLKLDSDDLAALDREFPPPKRKTLLAMT